MKYKNNYNGFTLVELVVYISLVSIMLLGIASFTKIILQTRARNQIIIEVEQQGIQIAQILTHTICNAENITLPVIGSTDSSLTLDVVSTGDDPTIFSLDGNIINIKEGAGNQINLNNSRTEVQDLILQNLSRSDTPGIVKFSFILNYNNQSGRPEYNYSKTFYGSTSLR